MFAFSIVSWDFTDGEVVFDRHDLTISSTERQTVLTGFLFHQAFSDLAVIEIDQTGGRHLTIYGMINGSWNQQLKGNLRPNTLFIDVATIAGRDRLITYEQGRVLWFDPQASSYHSLVSVTSNFVPPRKNEIPHVDITQDVNGDGRDDLVVPDKDGFWIAVQTRDSGFASPVKLGPHADLSGILGADGYRYDPWSQSRIHQIDYNGDDRRDLAFWSGNHFAVHLQDKHGRLARRPARFTTEIAFDTDRVHALANGKMAGRALHSLTDFNGDGIADLVIYALEGKRLSKKRSSYQVHYGTRKAGGLSFTSEIGATFQSKDRIQLRLDWHGTGPETQNLLRITSIANDSVRGNPWKSLKGFMGDDIGLNLEFYRRSAHEFAIRPNTVRGIGLDGAPSHREPGHVPLAIALRGATHEKRKTQRKWPRAFNPNLFIGDITGDGRVDLIKEATFRALNIYVGVPGPGLFAQSPQKVRIIVPHDEEYCWLVDLNRDGKQDILMHHPFTSRDVHGGRKRPVKSEPQQVTMLVMR